MKIGIITVATGKYYDVYVADLVRSVHRHFLPNHQREMFVLTERHEQPAPPAADAPCRLLFAPQLKWPLGSLMRFHWINQYAAEFADCDYLYYVDADMVVVDTVDEEVFADGLVAVRHPGFYPDKPGTFENNPSSLAFLPKTYKGTYFQGCFFGGKREAVLQMAADLMPRIQDDLDRNIIAVWYDESHLNWYFAQHPPAKPLLPSYAYVIPWKLPVPSKIVHLVKDHAAMRA